MYFVVAFVLPLLFLSCAQPTDSTDEGTVERERVEVSGPISEDTVWERGKDYVMVADVVVGGKFGLDNRAGCAYIC